MSWIDRINAAIVRRIHGKAALTPDAQGVDVAGKRLAYADLQRAVAYRHPGYVGDGLAVILDFGDERTVTVTEQDEAWKTILAGLDRHPRNQRPSSEWGLALVAGAPEARVELLR